MNILYILDYVFCISCGYVYYVLFFFFFFFFFARIMHLVLLPTTGFGCLEIIYMIYLL